MLNLRVLGAAEVLALGPLSLQAGVSWSWGGVEAAEGWRTRVGLSVVLLKCPFSRGVFP